MERIQNGNGNVDQLAENERWFNNKKDLGCSLVKFYITEDKSFVENLFNCLSEL